VGSGHRMIIRAAMALASISLVVLGACSHPGVGVEVGIEYRGGPAPGNSNALQSGTITILTADGEPKASGQVQEGHSFQASLPPGKYRVEARSGDAQCAPRGITVETGSQVGLHVFCSIR
jgi:hypothetical protein